MAVVVVASEVAVKFVFVEEALVTVGAGRVAFDGLVVSVAFALVVGEFLAVVALALVWE
jgi:hypothetical protein